MTMAEQQVQKLVPEALALGRGCRALVLDDHARGSRAAELMLGLMQGRGQNQQRLADERQDDQAEPRTPCPALVLTDSTEHVASLAP